MPHKSDSNYQEGATLSEPTRVSINTYPIFLLTSTLLVSLLSVSVWKFISAQLTGQGPGHWPVVPGGLVARILCSHCCSQTSVSGRNRNLDSSGCRLRRPEMAPAPISLRAVCTGWDQTRGHVLPSTFPLQVEPSSLANFFLSIPQLAISPLCRTDSMANFFLT